MPGIIEKIKEVAAEIEPDLVEVRHELHKIPETGDVVPKTHNLIVSELRKIDGLEVQEHKSTGYGVIATLRGNGEGNKCVMLRADIDALPIHEQNDLPWISTHEGKMHACGHDGHATWIIGAAKILSRLKDEWGGCVKFIFQPGEEVGKCASEFVNQDLVLQSPKVDAAFAAHGWPTIASGKIGIARHVAFGCVGVFRVEIIGKGGHASWPHLTIDPLAITLEIKKRWEELCESPRYKDIKKVLSFTYILGGDEHIGNIIPDTAKFGGTFRIANQQDIDDFASDLQSIVDEVVAAHGVTANCDIIAHKGNVENNQTLLPVAHEAAQEILGASNAYIIEEDNLGGENFATYSQLVPAVYMYVGIDEQADGSAAWLHSPDFMFDDNVLAGAAATFANLAIKVLES